MGFRWYLLRRLLKYSAPFITPVEKGFVRRYGSHDSQWPTIYIIGPPRSGSTIFYQLVTQLYDVLYIDNLTDMARSNLFLGMCMSRRRFGDKPHNNFTSRHGKTDAEDLHAPNEGLFWYKYLPADHHFVTADEIDPYRTGMISMYHNALKNKFERPLVIKNLSFSMRLDLIRKMEPDALIILVTRDPADVIYSIYRARTQLNWPENRLWSILPPRYGEIEKHPVPEQIVLQYKAIMDEIREKKLLFGENFFEIAYEEICRDPAGSLERVLSSVQNLRKKEAIIPELKFSTGMPAPFNEKIVSLLKQFGIHEK